MKHPDVTETLAGRAFWRVTAFPRATIAVGLAVIVAMAMLLPGLVKDTRSDAFLPADEPALQVRDQVRELFGLTDPLVVAVINDGTNGVFNPHSLGLVDWLTGEIGALDGVDPDRVTSLATENNITGDAQGLRVEPFWEAAPEDQRQADGVRRAVMDFPLYRGTLVAEDGTATLIIVELADQERAQALYQTLLALAQRAPVEAGERVLVAGEGAVSGYLGSYIDADAQRLNPVAAIIITTILFIAFRTVRGALLPNLVVLATVAAAVGLMAAFGVKFFVITNGLLPVLIGIAVADSIHIFSEYYETKARAPQLGPRELVVHTMVAMWRPISVTTLTTQAGFLGLYLASVMPPMRYFGLFAMVGVGAAWLYSVLVLPCWLSLLKHQPSPAYRPDRGAVIGSDVFGRWMSGFGRAIAARPALVLWLAAITAVVGVFGASRLEINEARIRTFQKDEPIVVADSQINARFDGVHYLDIFIETPAAEDLFEPRNLARIEALQAYLQTLPHVGGSTSVVDYLKQMNRSLDGGDADAYRLPTDRDLVAQYFLLYSASADPTDFQEVVDYDYRLANVRVGLDSGRYSDSAAVVEAAQRYIDRQFNRPGEITATLSGRVNVDYHWIKRLGETNWISVVLALAMVWLMASLTFRSLLAGTIAVLPVVLTVLVVYAVMAFAGIWLSVSTSMFAAIAIGLGVDFSVHTLERLSVLLRRPGQSMDDAIGSLFPSTGRALLFNFLALMLGFGVLVVSKVVVLQEFGVIVALAVCVSFITSLALLPAIAKVFRPRFLRADESLALSPLASLS